MRRSPSVLLLAVPLLILACGTERTRVGGRSVPTPAAEGLAGRVLVGYQGWFGTPSDGTGWMHWGPGAFEPGRCTIDLWPDLAGYPPSWTEPSPFRLPDGSPARVYSSARAEIVDHHLALMARHGIDGPVLQRFGVLLRSPARRAHADRVLRALRASARRHDRVWAVAFDLSGLRREELGAPLRREIRHVLALAGPDDDPRYLRVGGRPLVEIWGVGFDDGRDYGCEEVAELLGWLRREARPGGLAIALGVPTWWRTGERDATADPAFGRLCREADVLVPWTVGRYRDEEGARLHAGTTLRGDLAWGEAHGVELLPVVFPGFSWHNLSRVLGRESPLDEIPRREGRFLEAQGRAFLAAGARGLFVAMFDEVDEATAVMPCLERGPVGASPFVSGGPAPTDRYLRIAGELGRLARERAGAPDGDPRAASRRARETR
ncbi:MAG: glycoside hydrolase family 71/99-like protein [Planctomycetota bacterium]